MPVIAEAQRIDLSQVSNTELTQEIIRRISDGSYGTDVAKEFDRLDKKQRPVWTLKEGEWFRQSAARQPETIGRLVSGEKKDLDVLVEFFRKWGSDSKERCYVASMMMVTPITLAELPPTLLEKQGKGKKDQTPVFEIVAAVSPDDLFSEGPAVKTVPAPTEVQVLDDLFSEV